MLRRRRGRASASTQAAYAAAGSSPGMSSVGSGGEVGSGVSLASAKVRRSSDESGSSPHPATESASASVAPATLIRANLPMTAALPVGQRSLAAC